MYHYLQPVQNLAGDALPGYFVQATTAANAIVTMASDVGGTPINTISGVANMAMVDANGMVSFYVADGNYTLNVYAPDGVTLKSTFKDVPMVTSLSLAVGSVTALGAGATPTASINSGVSPALLNLGLPAGAQGIQGTTGAAGANSGTGANSSSRAAMAAITSQTAGTPVILTEAGREGTFVFSTANLSTQVAADTLQGIYVAPASDSTGATGAWVRKIDGPVRYPEWWGASPAVDSTAAINAALAAGAIVQLKSGDYIVSSTIAVPAYAHLRGVGCDYEGASTATRLLMASASATILQLGSTATPVDLNSAPAGARVSDLYVSRNTPPAAGSVGVLVGWSRFARLDNVRSAESISTFRFSNSIFCVGKHLFAKRAVAINTGVDQFIAYDFDGTGALPAAGGNASLWLLNPQAELNITIADSSAYRYTGRFTDNFLINPESVSFSYDLNVQGDSAGSPAISSNTNLTVIHPVFDACKIRSIKIDNVNKWGSIKISEPYIGPGVASEALRATACNGHIGIYGGHVRMGTSSAVAFAFDGVRGPVVDKVAIGECSAQAINLTGVVGGYIAPVTINATAVLSAAVQAISTTTDCTIEPFCQGDAAKVGIGYQSLAASNDYNTIRTTGMTRGVVSNKTTLAAGSDTNSTIEGPDGRQTKLGYAPGAGGTAAQATSKATGVTLNKVTGQITLNAASLAASAAVSFVFTNSTIAATDVIRLVVASGAATPGSYLVQAEGFAAGSCTISVRNQTAGALAEAIVLTYSVIKGQSA